MSVDLILHLIQSNHLLLHISDWHKFSRPCTHIDNVANLRHHLNMHIRFHWTTTFSDWLWTNVMTKNTTRAVKSTFSAVFLEAVEHILWMYRDRLSSHLLVDVELLLQSADDYRQVLLSHLRDIHVEEKCWAFWCKLLHQQISDLLQYLSSTSMLTINIHADATVCKVFAHSALSHVIHQLMF